MGGGRDRGDASVGGLVTTYRGEVEAVDQRMRRQMAEWRRRDDVAQGAEDGDEVGGGGAVREERRRRCRGQSGSAKPGTERTCDVGQRRRQGGSGRVTQAG